MVESDDRLARCGPMSDSVRFDRRDEATVVVTLDRPARRNACDRHAWRALRLGFERLAAEGEVRIGVLTGAGGHFCSGDDILDAASVRDDPAAAASYVDDIAGCFAALTTAPFTTVAAISGVCVGGGLSLAMGCDFRVATPDASFGIPASRLGLTYPVEQCGRLMALVGISWAKRILYGGERMDAATAQRIGLLDEIVAAEPVEAALRLAAPMRDAAPLTIAATKRALDALATGRAGREAASIEALMARILDSEDAREGPRAFAEKRRPRFTGR